MTLTARSANPAFSPPLLTLQFFRVGRTQLLSGTFRVGDIGELDGLAWHDGRDGVLIHELRMAVAAQEDAEIVEPGHDSLQLYAVDEKDGQRGLLLANVIEKRVLKALRAFCRHGLPRPFGHAYAVDGAGLLPCPALRHVLDAIKRPSRKGPDAKEFPLPP